MLAESKLWYQRLFSENDINLKTRVIVKYDQLCYYGLSDS